MNFESIADWSTRGIESFNTDISLVTQLSDYFSFSDYFSSKYHKSLNVSFEFLWMLLMIEDKRYFLHLGLDPFSILRATLSNYHKGRILQGASTITQQLYDIKQYGTNNLRKKTIDRKVRQTLWAFYHSCVSNKMEDLNYYLTHIYWGKSFYGINQASYGYIGFEPFKLSFGESFFLIERLGCPNKIRSERIMVLLSRPRILAKFKDADIDRLRQLYLRSFSIIPI